MYRLFWEPKFEHPATSPPPPPAHQIPNIVRICKSVQQNWTIPNALLVIAARLQVLAKGTTKSALHDTLLGRS